MPAHGTANASQPQAEWPMDRGATSPKSRQLPGGCALSKSGSDQVSRTRAREAGRRRYAPSLRLQGARRERRGQADFARVIVRILGRQAVPWGEPVHKMVDSLLSADPVRRPARLREGPTARGDVCRSVGEARPSQGDARASPPPRARSARDRSGRARAPGAAPRWRAAAGNLRPLPRSAAASARPLGHSRAAAIFATATAMMRAVANEGKYSGH